MQVPAPLVVDSQHGRWQSLPFQHSSAPIVTLVHDQKAARWLLESPNVIST